MALVCVGLLLRADRQIRGAKDASESGEQHLAHERYREAADAFRNGAALIDGVPGQGKLRERLRQGLHSAQRGQVMADLHTLCEQVRPLYAVETAPQAQLQAVADQCRAVWDRRQAIARQLSAATESEESSSWRQDLLDLGILTANLEVEASPPAAKDAARRRALDTLRQAEELFGKSGVLNLERART